MYKASDPSEMSVIFYQTIQYNIPDENTLHTSEVLKTHNITTFLSSYQQAEKRKNNGTKLCMFNKIANTILRHTYLKHT